MRIVTAKGAKIPALGFGTFELRQSEAFEAVSTALEVGYRHIDTAQIYGNEAEVGAAIAESRIPREEIFLTTKVWPDNFGPDELRPSVVASLQRLQTDYVDLLLLHWPGERHPMADVLGRLAELRMAGMADHIGVSNFTTLLLDEAVRHSPVELATNQVECHPFLDQSEVLAAVRERGMALTAYSPLARGKVFGNERLAEIGRRHGKTEGQVALRWLIQQPAVVAIPRSSDPDHIAENFDVFDFALSHEEMQRVSGLTEADRRLIDPRGLAPAWD